ncbi:MAG: 50S ribosomal protein L17 [Candidatus Paceibacterota bacterium]
MRHHNNVRKFGRPSSQRKALLKSLARSLVLHENINTTEAKAKELRPFIEKLITAGKTNTPTARRQVSARLGSPVAVKKIFDTLSPKYIDRKGGYTRIVKLPIRLGDGAKMAHIEFV